MAHQWKPSEGERYQVTIEAEVQRIRRLGRAALKGFKAADVTVSDFEHLSLVAVLEVDGRPLVYPNGAGLVFSHPYLIALVYPNCVVERGSTKGVNETIRAFMEEVFRRMAEALEEQRRLAILARPNLVDEW